MSRCHLVIMSLFRAKCLYDSIIIRTFANGNSIDTNGKKCPPPKKNCYDEDYIPMISSTTNTVVPNGKTMAARVFIWLRYV